jgi:hypothetical protein
MYFLDYIPAKHPAIILPVVSYWCENWYLTLRAEQRPRVFDSKMLRKILGLSGTKKQETGINRKKRSFMIRSS